MLTLSRPTQKLFINSIEKDEFYYGEWWLPSNPERKIKGVLYFYKSGGIRLHLLGTFLVEPHPEKLKSWEVMLGITIPGGSPITLIDCREYERQKPFIYGESESSQRFEAKTAVFGFHFQNKESFIFTKIEFGMTYLVDWFNPDLIVTEIKHPAITVSNLPDNVISIEYGNTVVKFASRCQYTNSPDYSQSFTQRSWISVESEEPLPYEEYVAEYIGPLHSFIQFGTSYLNSITFIQGYIEDTEFPAKIVTTVGFSRIERAKNPIVHYKLFNLQDIQEKLTSIVTQWLELHDKHQHIFDLYFDSLQIDPQFPISKFLILVQALESLHTKNEIATNPKGIVTRDTFLNNKKQILSAIQQPQLKDWLNKKFNYLPELKVRIGEMISDCPEIMTPIVHDAEFFISRLVKTRNYYTHYNPKLKGKAAAGVELDLLAHALRVLLNFHLLFNMGLSKRKCITIIQDSTYYIDVERSCRDFGLWNRTAE